MPEYDGLYEIEWRYQIDVSGKILTHSHTFDVKVEGTVPPGTPFANIELVPRVGSLIELDTWLQNYADVLTPLQGVGTEIEEIILWKYDAEPSLAKIYISSATTFPTTSYSGTPVTAQGLVLTFRQAGYRYPMRMQIMEGNQSGESRYSYGAMGATTQAYCDFVVASDTPIQGRADVYPIAVIALNLGQNEKLRNLRYRSP